MVCLRDVMILFGVMTIFPVWAQEQKALPQQEVQQQPAPWMLKGPLPQKKLQSFLRSIGNKVDLTSVQRSALDKVMLDVKTRQYYEVESKANAPVLSPVQHLEKQAKRGEDLSRYSKNTSDDFKVFYNTLNFEQQRQVDLIFIKIYHISSTFLSNTQGPEGFLDK